MSKDLKYLDQRTYQRNIKSGLIKEDDYKSHMKALPDDAQNCEEVPFEDENAILEDEIEGDDSNEETMKLE